jgi:AcrR family transcriptional regulator
MAMTARSERVAAEEVRQRMLDAGRELALEAGAALTIEHLRLEEVIQRARVPRSSVYRMWPYREAYIDDLLTYLAGAGSYFSDRPVNDPDTSGVARKIVVENAHLLATAAGRRSLLCEVVRVTCTHNYDELSASTPFRLHMALLATLGYTRSGEARRRIAAALEDSQLRSRESIVALLRNLALVLGLRLRDPAYSLDHVQLAGGLLVQATAMRNIQVRAVLAPDDGTVPHEGADEDDEGADLAEPRYVNDLLNAPLPGPGLHGRPAEWNLTAYAYLGIVDAFLEPDPDFTPPSPE